MKQAGSPQQVIDLLAKRWEEAARRPVKCTLGRKPLPRRGGACSVCRAQREFELDHAIAQLINARAFKGTGACPYRVITSHLVAGVTAGPEVLRAQSVGQYRVDPVLEIKGALIRIRTIIRATRLTREDIESFEDKGDWPKALSLVRSAERALEDALAFFQSQSSGKIRRSARGRTGRLHIQAVARAMATAWHALTGHLPAKDNEKFHDLLAAAVTTIFGYPKKLHLESATRTAVEHVRKDAASGC